MTIEDAEEIYMASVVGKFRGTRAELAQALIVLAASEQASNGTLLEKASETIRSAESKES